MRNDKTKEGGEAQRKGVYEQDKRRNEQAIGQPQQVLPNRITCGKWGAGLKVCDVIRASEAVRCGAVQVAN